MLIHIFMDMLTNFAAYIGSFLLFKSIYPMKKENLRKKQIIMFVLIAAQALYSIYYNTLLNSTTGFLLFLLMAKLFFKTKKFNYIIHSVIIMISMAVVEAVSVLLVSKAYGAKNVFDIYYDSSIDIVRYPLNIMLSFVDLYLLSFLFRKKVESNSKNQLIFFTVLNAVEAALIVLITKYSYERTVGFFMVTFSAICLGFDLYILYSFYRFSENTQKEKINDLIIQQSAMQKKAYEELSEKYYESVSLVHDIKNHINSLEALTLENNTEKAAEYKKTLLDKLDRLTPEFRNENHMLAVIINQKLSEARKHNTELIMNIESTDMGFLDDFDITSIFSNLLDNSIEACGELEEDERVINLNIEERLNFLIVNIRNPYNKINILPDESFSTTKSGHMGIGLINVRQTVEKYGGIFKISTENNQFAVQISIPLHAV